MALECQQHDMMIATMQKISTQQQKCIRKDKMGKKAARDWMCSLLMAVATLFPMHAMQRTQQMFSADTPYKASTTSRR